MASSNDFGIGSASTQKFEQKAQAVQYPKITSIFDFSAEALGQLNLWLEQNPPVLPITSIIGFSQFTANFVTVTTAESTNSTGFTNLATVGPQLTGISDGNYVLLYGAQCYTDTVSAGFAAQFAPQVNSDAIPASDRLTCPVGDYTSIAGFTTHKVSNGGDSTIKLLYRSSGGPAANAFFQNRVLIALRYSNL